MTSDEGKEGFRCQVSGVRAKRHGAESKAHRVRGRGQRVVGDFYEWWRLGE
jgi:hypothetical protein